MWTSSPTHRTFFLTTGGRAIYSSPVQSFISTPCPPLLADDSGGMASTCLDEAVDQDRVGEVGAKTEGVKKKDGWAWPDIVLKLRASRLPFIFLLGSRTRSMVDG